MSVTRCRADSAAACPWRYAAVRREEMLFGETALVWLWFASPLHVWVVERCPGCGGALPDLPALTKRWQADGWPTTDEGAE